MSCHYKNKMLGMLEYWNAGKNFGRFDINTHHSTIPMFRLGCGLCPR